MELDRTKYLHLYLGCKMIYASHHEPQNETYILTLENIKEAIEFRDMPVLKNRLKITRSQSFDRGKYILDSPKKYKSSAFTKWMLDNHYDIFGLIEAKEAFDEDDPFLK